METIILGILIIIRSVSNLITNIIIRINIILISILREVFHLLYFIILLILLDSTRGLVIDYIIYLIYSKDR